MFKKILLIGVALIMCLGLFTGCGTGEDVEFVVGEGWTTSTEKPIAKIITSLSDIADDNIGIEEKYDSSFFEKYSLVIVSFRTRSSGATIEEIKATKNGNRLTVAINGTNGVMEMIGQTTVILEVKKADISGVKNVSFTTNLNKF